MHFKRFSSGRSGRFFYYSFLLFNDSLIFFEGQILLDFVSLTYLTALLLAEAICFFTEEMYFSVEFIRMGFISIFHPSKPLEHFQ